MPESRLEDFLSYTCIVSSGPVKVELPVASDYSRHEARDWVAILYPTL